MILHLLGALLTLFLGAAALLHELRRLRAADHLHARHHARALRRLVVDAPSRRATCLPPPMPTTSTR